MKKIIAYIAAALFISMGINKAQAQDELQLTIGYNANMPLGGFKDFMGKNSFRGFNGELSYPLNDRLRVGLGTFSSDYYVKYDRQIYDTKGGAISAVRTHSLQTMPVLARVNYTFIPAAAVRPYVGVGAGFNIISFNEYLGEFNNVEHSAFKPAVSAGAGLNIPFNKTTGRAGINLGADYNFMPFNYSGIKNLNNWGAHLGVYFPLR